MPIARQVLLHLWTRVEYDAVLDQNLLWSAGSTGGPGRSQDPLHNRNTTASRLGDLQDAEAPGTQLADAVLRAANDCRPADRVAALRAIRPGLGHSCYEASPFSKRRTMSV
jgi:hypothetical protein